MVETNGADKYSGGARGASFTPLSPTENLNNSTTHQTGREEKSGAFIFSATGVDLACMDETINHTLYSSLFYSSILGLGGGGGGGRKWG